MKKKKKNPDSEHPGSATNLKALIHDHSLFFDRLVDLIPPRFYLSTDDAEDRPWYPGLSKSQRAAAKKQTRENTKKSRRARLDPSQSSSTLDILKDKAESGKPPVSSDRSVTYEELRERLHKRLEELRSNRNTRTDRIPKGKEDKKRKREDDNDQKPKSKKKEEENSAPVDFSFGKVKLGDEEGKGRRRKKKVSKVQELEKAKRLQEMKKDPEKGDDISKKHSWKAAEERAAGGKVLDNPKLLKESLKREKRKRQKSAQKWRERIESRDKLMEEKQKKRSENIKERIHQTKMRKIEKREKKLMRPGFEGRREGFANGGSSEK